MDKTRNFWISSLSKRHEKLVPLLFEIVKSPDMAHKWLSEGITYLSPKTKVTKNPKNYIPIICLTTKCKLLTSILTVKNVHSYGK